MLHSLNGHLSVAMKIKNRDKTKTKAGAEEKDHIIRSSCFLSMFFGLDFEIKNLVIFS